MNESNTKVLLIEPVLEALGWSTTNLDSVTREFRVFDGTFLDYALQGDGRPRLFIEAKSWGSHLGDPKWIAQTVNYANNEGVVWCALSDGMVYRVYKTNEPVDMASKLVFEVDLRNYADSDQRQSVLRYLSLLSRDAVLDGGLDSLGSRLFDETRIRKALEELFNHAPNRFVTLIREHLPQGERTLTPGEIRDVLKRVGKGLLPTAALPQSVAVAATISATASSPKASKPPSDPVKKDTVSEAATSTRSKSISATSPKSSSICTPSYTRDFSPYRGRWSAPFASNTLGTALANIWFAALSLRNSGYVSSCR